MNFSWSTAWRLLPWFLVLCVVIACLWVYGQKGKTQLSLQDAQSKLTAAQTLNKAYVTAHADDQQTIRMLTDYRQANDKIMADFVSKMAGLEGKFSTFGSQLDNLRKHDATVDIYLSQPIPPALRDLLNGVRRDPQGRAVADSNAH